jgi:hypothetical protein
MMLEKAQAGFDRIYISLGNTIEKEGWHPPSLAIDEQLSADKALKTSLGCPPRPY